MATFLSKIKVVIAVVILLFLSSSERALGFERSIVIVTASYNNKEWYRYNVHSVLSQKYSNYHWIYIDDCSEDGTGDAVEQLVAQLGASDRVTVIKNKSRLLALENHYDAIYMCHEDDIIFILDGDDWLPHNDVLAYINQIYADETVWMTYGQFVEYPCGARGFNRDIPQAVIDSNGFRQHYSALSHARTFYASLFKKIKKEDLTFEGVFLPMCADIAVMMPMVEMARHHFRFISDILYVYNGQNCINDHKISKNLQWSIDLWVRSRAPYEALELLF